MTGLTVCACCLLVLASPYASAAEIVVDNVDATVVGSWAVKTHAGYGTFIDTNYLKKSKTTGVTDTVTFTPNLTESGSYAVYHHNQTKTTSATNVLAEIVHAGGTALETFGQHDISHRGWQLIGTYTFNAGTSGSVTISNVNVAAGKYIHADAVKFVGGGGPTQYTLTVNTAGTGAGTVDLDPATGPYDADTVVTLTATPNQDSDFDTWSGDLTTTNAMDTVTMTSNKSVTATFDLLQATTYTLTVDDTGGTGTGTVTLDPATGPYDPNTVVTLTATADGDSEFITWSGDLTTQTTPDMITMTSNKSVTATFDMLPPPSPNDGPIAHWKLDETSGTTASDASGSGYVGTLMNGPEWTTGHRDGAIEFLDKSDFIDLSANPVPLGVDWTITAWFTTPLPTSSKTRFLIRNGVDMAIGATGTGGILGTDPGVFLSTGYDLTQLADGWHHVAAVGSDTDTVFYVDGAYVATCPGKTEEPMDSIGKKYTRFSETIDDVRVYDRALTAQQISNLAGAAPPAQFALIVDDSLGTGEGNVTLEPPGGMYTEGTVVTLSANNDPGSIFLTWGIDLSGPNTPKTLLMNSNKTVTAQFEQNPPPVGEYTLAVNYAGTGTGSVTLNPATGPYVAGTIVTLTATEDSGSDFTTWSGNLDTKNDEERLVMNEDKSVTATFTLSSGVSYTITASKDYSGRISPIGAISVPEGATLEFAMSGAVDQYEVSDVTVDGQSVGAVSIYPFENVTANATIDLSVSFNQPALQHPIDWKLSEHIQKKEGRETLTADEEEYMDYSRSPMIESSFYSTLHDEDTPYFIYLPPSYETEPTRTFPVVYFLHGAQGDPWVTVRHVHYLDPEIQADNIPEMIYVGVQGRLMSMWTDDKTGPDSKTASMITTELIPHIDATYRTKTERQYRMIEGRSMGGYGAAHLGFKYYDLFGAVSAFAAPIYTCAELQTIRSGIYNGIFDGDMDYCTAQSPWTLVDDNADELRGNTYIRWYIGTKDVNVDKNQNFHDLMNTLNLTHEYQEVPNAGHQQNGVWGNATAPYDFYNDVWGNLP